MRVAPQVSLATAVASLMLTQHVVTVFSFSLGRPSAFLSRRISENSGKTGRTIIGSTSVREAAGGETVAVAAAASHSEDVNNDDSTPYFSIASNPHGPGDHPVHSLTFHRLPGQDPDVPPIVVETGKIGRQAAGAVTLVRGDTVLYATAARDDKPKTDLDFLPLSVEHQERFSSAGMTSGAYNRRDGRPAEHEILTCRLIDRPLRPLIKNGWRHETQLLSWVLSYDGLRSCDSLAIVSSATALYLSDVPLLKPVAAVQVGMLYDDDKEEKEEEIPTAVEENNNDSDEDDDTTETLLVDDSTTNGESSEEEATAPPTTTTTTETIKKDRTFRFVVNPTHEQMEKSQLHLTVAGTADAVLMIEGAAEFLPEERFIEAVKLGHDAIKVLCQGIQALGDTVGITKKLETIAEPPAGLQDRVNELFTDKIDEMFAQTSGANKEELGSALSELRKTVVEQLEREFPEETNAIKAAFKDLFSRRMYFRAKQEGLRSDGRQLNQVRRIDVEAGFLPRVHGSALFTRGETQALATATLGDSSMRQKIDTLDGLEAKRFYLQYTFPPSCVGETGRVGQPGRREVGHGNLAERALIPTLPSEEEFPYTIRVESLITESHGSSSMASVCGGCMALMDAGVPVKKTVAGIAMGMLLGDKDGVSDENAVILSDISGTEDALGTMDFKVAGDREGITTFQLDIKCEGLTLETMERALAQAREGRLHILNEMEKALAKPREELPATVPKMSSFSVPFESIGKIIGPGGKQIRAIIEDFNLVNMDVKDDGKIQVSSFETSKLKEAEEFVKLLIGGGGGRGRGGGRGPNGADGKVDRPEYVGPEPVVGETYTGKITGIHPFGVFVEILPGPEDGSTPGLEGLVHVSELARERVRNCEGFMRSMGVEELTVKYIGKDKGKFQLSRKAVLEDRNGAGGGNSRRPRSDTGSARTSTTDASSSESSSNIPSTMPPDEVDIIAQAIDGILEL